MESKKSLQSIDEVIDFLKHKGSNHKYYYHYTTWDSLSKIIRNKSFLLTRGNSISINDQHEALMKGSHELWNKTYIGSFAFGSSENMAMWGLYGLPWEDAVRVAIPKQEMLKWIYGIKEVYIWNNRKIDKIDEFDLSLADMLYVSGSSTGKDMKLTHKERSWSTINMPGLHRLDTAPQMTGYIKNFAWHYENEVRIRIQLPYSTGYEKILLDIPQSTIDSFQITTGPNFVWKDDALFKQLIHNGRINESSFNGLVKYRELCSLCQHKSFERREA